MFAAGFAQPDAPLLELDAPLLEFGIQNTPCYLQANGFAEDSSQIIIHFVHPAALRFSHSGQFA
jgi:hypothetical protein